MFESRESSRFSPDLADCCSPVHIVARPRQRAEPRLARLAGENLIDADPTVAAADIEQPLASLQHELAQDVIELLLLRGIEIFAAVLEIGAGINPVRVQPQCVKVICAFIMVADGVAVALAVVAPGLGRTAPAMRGPPGGRFSPRRNPE